MLGSECFGSGCLVLGRGRRGDAVTRRKRRGRVSVGVVCLIVKDQGEVANGYPGTRCAPRLGGLGARGRGQAPCAGVVCCRLRKRRRRVFRGLRLEPGLALLLRLLQVRDDGLVILERIVLRSAQSHKV